MTDSLRLFLNLYNSELVTMKINLHLPFAADDRAVIS